MTEFERQDRNGKFVENNVYCCQSVLVDSMLQQDVFNYEEIENRTTKTHLPSSKAEVMQKGRFSTGREKD